MRLPGYACSPPAAFVLFCACAFLVFGRVLSGELVSDDRLWLGTVSSDHKQVAKEIGQWTYRPISTAVYGTAKVLFGGHVPAWHTLSILLHALNATLLYALLPRLLPGLSASAALLATLAFLLHPAGSEGVLWISAMAEPLGALCVLLFFHAYLRWRAQWTIPRLLGLGLFALAACFAKETAIVLPLLVLAYELLHGTRAMLTLARVVSIVALASVLFLLARMLALGSLSGGIPTSPNIARVFEMAAAHFAFIWLPYPGPFALKPPEVALVSGPASLLASALFLALLALAWRAEKARPLLLFAILWGMLLIWPAYVLANVRDGFFSARQAYMATLAVPMILAAAWLAMPRPGRAGLAAAFGAALLWMGYATWNHADTWRTNLGVFQQSLAITPSSDELKLAIADEEAERGRVDAALAVYREVITRTGNERLRAAFLFDMARITNQANRLAESNRYLNEALTLHPNFAHAWTGLGNNAWVEGRLADAEQHYRRALALDPTNHEANVNLKSLLTQSLRK